MENPSFFLEGIVREKDELQNFEGPLNLILMLLSKNKIEIRDIKIADILDQYLAYLAEMQSMDLEIASDFVQMAAQLLYIKTKTLLSGGEREVSELEVLMESLEELKARNVQSALQRVLPALKAASETGLLYYTKPPEPLPPESREYTYTHEPVDMLRAMYAIYSRGGKMPDTEQVTSAMPRRIVYSVRDKSRQILSLLRTGRVRLNELYRSCTSRAEIIAAFVSVLELCSMGSVRLERSDGGEYELSFMGGDTDEIIEQITE